jgi:Ion channel
MHDSHSTLLAAATTGTSPDVLQQIPGTLERGAADIESLPLFEHLSAVMPAADLLFGGAVMICIVLVHAAGVRAVTTHVLRRTQAIMQHPSRWQADLLMSGIVFMLLSLHVAEMFLWAAALVYSGLVPDWRSAGFFAGNTYTTVGYGSFILPNGWRMLAPIIAMSGLFTFGWSGSVLVDFVRRLNTIRDAAVNPERRPPAAS